MKLHTGRSLLMAFSLLSVAASLQADPIVINFDNEPEGIKAGFVHPAVAILSAETDGLRLVATATGFGIGPAAAATSPPHVAFGAAGLPAFFHDLIGTFFVPPVQAGYVRASTDLVSFAVVGTESGQTEPWQALILGRDIFGPDFVLSPLETLSGTTDRVVTFQRPQRDIFGFFLVTTRSYEAIDDLTFNTPVGPPVPEPTTLVMVASGLALCARRLRVLRRKGKTSIQL
jgi:hypothetical protein